MFLDGKWLKVDSYIVDSKLSRAIKERLQKEGREQGYGAALRGTSVWDGESNAFSQFVGEDVIQGEERGHV